LDQEFSKYAKELAGEFGSGVNFKKPSELEKKDMPAWLEANPDSYWGLRSRCTELIRRKTWDDALTATEKLKEMLPDDHSDDGVYAMLATIHRSKNDLKNERMALVSLAERSADCRQALMRLIELDTSEQDWEGVSKWCDRMIEIDPLRSDVQQQRATANEKIGRYDNVIQSLEACLEMDLTDPASIHYRLAVALNKQQLTSQAKRHLLMALEEVGWKPKKFLFISTIAVYGEPFDEARCVPPYPSEKEAQELELSPYGRSKWEAERIVQRYCEKWNCECIVWRLPLIVGENARDNDLVVNPTKEKKLTNVRAAGSDENVILKPPRDLSLEAALEYIEDDELVEVTPNIIRIRKVFLRENERRRQTKSPGELAIG
jgi:tetratricopeptide (TPR) repeat protein